MKSVLKPLAFGQTLIVLAVSVGCAEDSQTGDDSSSLDAGMAAESSVGSDDLDAGAVVDTDAVEDDSETVDDDTLDDGTAADASVPPTDGADMDAGPSPFVDASDAAPQVFDAAAFDAGISFDAMAGDAHDSGTAMPARCELVVPTDCELLEGTDLPTELRCTGLYSDWDSRALSECLLEYTPAYELWSDGAEKRRFAYLPPGTTVDVSDPDEFRYPVGTKFFKEFTVVDDEGAQVVGETRLLHKTESGWQGVAYVWSEDGQTAEAAPDGTTALFSGSHDVPSVPQCTQCHSGRADFILGWDAFMLGEGSLGLDIETALAEGWLTDASEAPWSDFHVPGNQTEQAALGYLHANCGITCHTEAGRAAQSGLLMRLDVEDITTVQTTGLVVTGINKEPAAMGAAAAEQLSGGPFYDIIPGFPEQSLLVARMSIRGAGQMPQFGSNQIDEDGVSLIADWIESMTEAGGYPAAEFPPDEEADAGVDDPVVDDGPVSYAEDLEPYFVQACAPSCHAPGGVAGPDGFSLDAIHDLSLGAGYGDLTSLMSIQVPSMPLIGATPEESYLWYKVQGRQTEVGGYGESMPFFDVISPEWLDVLERWIEDGAQP